MLTYHFTNDIRFENLEENLRAVARHIHSEEWNHIQTLQQAKNGWYPAYQLYFGLYENSNNVNLIINGKVIEVIAEFVKKFQFPNARLIRDTNAMQIEMNNGQQLAPLRQVIKLLFYKLLVEQVNSTSISTDDFVRYILLNEEVATNQINLEQNYAQLVDESLATHNLDFSYYGGDKPRFITQLLGILEKLPFININNNQITLSTDGLSLESKQILLDVIAFNDYWIPTSEDPRANADGYKEYMQAIVSEDENEDENIINSTFSLDSIYNLISYGAPGTGKSYLITEKIKENYPEFEDSSSNDSSNVFRTTLHPEYTYSDFVGQIMPTITDDGPTYKFSPGVFTLALKRALELEERQQPVYLVLEELSRANVAATFGDLFQLLDREEGKSEYSISNPLIAKYVYNYTDEALENGSANTKIYLPSNLYIYATVNTNDQNVFVMDTAFKRRFDWQYVSTKPTNGDNNPILSIVNSNNEEGHINWHNLYQKLNEYITKSMKLGEDKQVGQFFIKFTNDDAKNKNKIQNKLLQYLWDDIERTSFNGAKLFNQDISNFADLYEKFEEGMLVFSDEFLDSLQGYVSYINDTTPEATEEESVIEQEEQNSGSFGDEIEE